MMLGLLKKYCVFINADKQLSDNMKKVVYFFRALKYTKVADLYDEQLLIYDMYQEFKLICNNGRANADHIAYKDARYALIFLCYAATIKEPLKQKLILDSLLLLHNGYMSGAKEGVVSGFDNETCSNELLPSINANIIARLVPEIGEFLKEHSLLTDEKLPLDMLIVDSDDRGTQENVLEMFGFYLSDKFSTEELIGILTTLFLDKNFEDGLGKLLKHNEEAIRSVVCRVMNNLQLSGTLYPIIPKLFKSVDAEQGKTLLNSMIEWDKGTQRLLKNLLFDNNTNLHYRSHVNVNIGLHIIADALKQNNTLLALDLLGNKIGDNSVKYIADALKQNNTLSLLFLSCNQIGDKGANHIADALEKNKTLSTLSLSSNQIGDKGANHIADALTKNNTLSELSLAGNQIGDKGANHIADALKQNKTLLNLNLTRNKIEDNSVKYIADALKQNNTLSFLCLMSNQIGDEGANYIADALKQNETLLKLDLAGNQIGDKGANHIADALKQNKTLLKLHLEENQIGDEGANHIADALKQNKTLSRLALTRNKIGDKVVEAIYEAVLSSGRTTTFSCDICTRNQKNKLMMQ